MGMTAHGPYRQVVFILFYLIKEGLQKCSLYLQGVIYLEVTFNTGLTVALYTSSGTILWLM